MVSLVGLAYQGFSWLSSILMKLLYRGEPSRLKGLLEVAGIKMFPEAYLSIIGFLLSVSTIISVTLTLLTGLFPVLLVPISILLIGYMIPKIKAKDRAAKLDMEAPFMAAYVSVMATGGLSPFLSLKRLKDCKLLPNTSRTAKQIEVDVHLKGMDPIAAIEKYAEKSQSKEYKEFLLGYVQTLRAGGDVVHYLLTRTEIMFRDLAAKIKIFGERAAMFLESYVALMILGTLGISIVYLTSIAFRGYWQSGFTAEDFLLYSYVIVPVISALFMYLSDLSSFQEPTYETTPYKILMASLPVTAFLAFTMFLPYIVPELEFIPLVSQFKDLLTSLRTFLRLERGLEPALGLGVALITGTLPAAVAHSYYDRSRGKKIINEVTNFIRDVTETRKTGISPESCIVQLSSRPYGVLNKHLKIVARQIKWGQPIRVIYESLRRRIRSWYALMNLYLLVDAIEIGGGSPETLETMAKFGEIQASLEKEKRCAIRPLVVMPYVGATLMIFSTLVTVNFMNSAVMSVARMSIPFAQILTIIVPALVFQSYLMGIVTGKVSSGSISAGFWHAIALTCIAILSTVFMHALSGVLQF